MELILKIHSLNYRDVARKVLPLVKNALGEPQSAAAKTAAVITQLPEDLICSILDAIPQEQKNEILAGFAGENAGRILELANRLSETNGIGVTLSSVTVSNELEVTAVVERIDYPTVFERFLPTVREKLLSLGAVGKMMCFVIHKASAQQLCDLMDRFHVDKDATAVSLLNQNAHTLATLIREQAEAQGIRLKIDSISAR